MRNRSVSFCALLLILVAAPASGQQVTGTISGSVRDTSGAAVGTASIRLVSAATGAERQALTDEAGNFVLASVDPGEYKLTVQAPGFKTLERNGVILTASDRLSVGALALEVGNVEERVTVTAQGSTVQTVSSERSSKTLLRGPGINNWDIALFKNFSIREGLRAQFRLEGYNAFNHTQFSTFDSTARFDASGKQVNAQFGQFTAARDPRILQLAVRLQF
jgi:hypothetical protein